MVKLSIKAPEVFQKEHFSYLFELGKIILMTKHFDGNMNT